MLKKTVRSNNDVRAIPRAAQHVRLAAVSRDVQLCRAFVKTLADFRGKHVCVDLTTAWRPHPGAPPSRRRRTAVGPSSALLRLVAGRGGTRARRGAAGARGAKPTHRPRLRASTGAARTQARPANASRAAGAAKPRRSRTTHQWQAASAVGMRNGMPATAQQRPAQSSAGGCADRGWATCARDGDGSCSCSRAARRNFAPLRCGVSRSEQPTCVGAAAAAAAAQDVTTASARAERTLVALPLPCGRTAVEETPRSRRGSGCAVRGVAALLIAALAATRAPLCGAQVAISGCTSPASVAYSTSQAFASTTFTYFPASGTGGASGTCLQSSSYAGGGFCCNSTGGVGISSAACGSNALPAVPLIFQTDSETLTCLDTDLGCVTYECMSSTSNCGNTTGGIALRSSGGAPQLWQWAESSAAGYYQLVHAASGYCLFLAL